MLLKIVLAIFVLVVAMSSVAILKNGVPLAEAPGLGKRLWVYLSRNTARTDPDHDWPDLRTPTYPVSAAELYSRVKQSMADLDWDIVEENETEYTLHAVVSTPLLGFKDDVCIRIEETAGGKTAMNVISASRVGRADYGANVAHVIALTRELSGVLN